MPDTFDLTQFFVSPYVKGLDPVYFNAYYLGGGYSCFVRDGAAYNGQAYDYDPETGEIRRNVSYRGVNALFSLPVDINRADAQKAAEILDSINYMENVRRKGQSAEIEIPHDVEEWLDGITPDNINDMAVPVERSRKTVSVREFYELEFGEYPESISDRIEETVMELYFPKGTGMSERMVRYATTWEDAWIGTYTLNADGTITYLRYVAENESTTGRGEKGFHQ